MRDGYGGLKDDIRASRLIMEQEKEDERTFALMGSIITLHGINELTEEMKQNFIDTVNDFKVSVSSMVEFYPLNIYEDDIDWSGNIIDQGMEFIFSIGKGSGLHITNNVTLISDEYLETVEKLKNFYEKFKAKWGPVIFKNNEIEQ